MARSLKTLGDRADSFRRSRRRRLLGTTALAGLLAALSISPGHAVVWTGTLSTDWFNAGNWTPGFVPIDQLPASIQNNSAANAIVGNPGAVANSLFVGNSVGSGTLLIQNGGTLVTFASFLGSDSNAGVVFVTGPGSTFTSNGGLEVGFTGTGTGEVFINNGGTLKSTNAMIGDQNSSSGLVSIDGATSSWKNNGGISIGNSGNGIVTVSNGATVSTSISGISIGGSGSSHGTGTLNIGSVSGIAPTAPGIIATSNITFGNSASSIVFNHTSNNYVFGSPISGDGSVIVETGTTILTGANTYTGGTTIVAGMLQLGNGGTTGSIIGNVTMTNNTAANNTTFAFNRSDTYGFGGLISGSGVVEQNGTGTITFTATNTYSGGTILNGGTLSVAADANLGGAASALAFNGGALQITGTAFTSTARVIGWGTNGGGFDIADANNTFTVNQAILSGGVLTKAGAGTLVLTANDDYAGTMIAAGTLQLGNGGTTGSITHDVSNNGTLAFNRSNPYQFDGVISGSGGLQQNGRGTTTLTADNAYTGGTTISAGILQLGNGGASGSIVGNVLDNATLAVKRSDSFTLAGQISGTGTFQQLGTGTTILTNANTYAGGTTIAGGTLRVENNAALGTGAVTTTGSVLDYANGISLANHIQIDSNHTQLQVLAGNATQAGIISELNGPRPLEKIGAGSLVLTAVNTYTGTTTVSGGTLSVNGSIASSSLTTVNTGGTLGGNGTVGDTTINGGALAPGNSIGLLTVQGNLAFTAASSYMVEVSPSNADRTNVMGVATLGGATVNASFAPGTFVAKQYTILNAAGGVSGSFNGPVNSNLPANFKSSLSYDANDVFLNLALVFVAPPTTGLSGNQQRVGNAITGFFNSNGSIPMVFGALTSGGLSQISGETATGSQQTTFDAMNLFMGTMTDPSIEGRGDRVSSSSGVPQFAEDDGANAYAGNGKPRTKSERDAYAAIYRKAPIMADPFAQRWSVWAAGYGGSQTTDGNASFGSNSTTSRVFGTAAGADYRFSPDTLAGFALAGGGTNFSVNGSGSGRSDLFQAGAFVRHTTGPAYMSAALAYGWQDVTTDRTVTAAGSDMLRARFNANAFSGRVEGGYRFVTPWLGGVGLTPYAAGQFTTFDLPAYAEQVLSGTNTFALAYGSKSVTDTRSELGLRTDQSFAMQDSILTLRGRFAWAHDFNPDRNIAATFQTLPGASFVVNGAAQASDSALTTASAELKWRNGWSAAATFEGEFSDVTRSYAGKGVVRYAW
jgi:T5SS/PEP-CTERM-associated repeat protein/autotransporter-associated beta strand protein